MAHTLIPRLECLLWGNGVLGYTILYYITLYYTIPYHTKSSIGNYFGPYITLNCQDFKRREQELEERELKLQASSLPACLLGFRV